MGRGRQLAALLQGGSFQAQIDALDLRLDTAETINGQQATQLLALPGMQSTLAQLGIDLDAAEAVNTAQASAITTLQATVAAINAGGTLFQSFADNYTSVPIGQPLQSFWRSVNHVDVGNVAAGQKFLVIGQGQVRSDWDFNVECIPWLTWTAPGGSIADDGTGHNSVGFYIVGRNTRQSQDHYYDWTRSSVIQFTAPQTNVRFHNRMRHRSSDPSIDGSGNQAMIVGLNQGGIIALRIAA